MNVLLVDDEESAIEGTLAAVDWKKLGVNEVFTAANSFEARKVINKELVDIIVCDIEMPEESGIELLRWVKKSQPEIEPIFLTAHADFIYAKEAVRLGCLDYLLKPILSEELEQVLDKAIHQVNQKKLAFQYRQYGQYWLQNEPLVLERFWLDILNGVIPTDQVSFEKIAKERSVPYSDKTNILPILIKIQRWYREMDLLGEKHLESELRAAAEETIKNLYIETNVIPVERGHLVSIINISNQNLELTALIARLEAFIAFCNNHFHCDLSIYIGDQSSPRELNKIMEKLHLIDINNVVLSNQIFTINKKWAFQTTIKKANFEVWSNMLKEGLKKPLWNELNSYHEYLLIEKDVGFQVLIQFYQDFLQMVHYVLQVKGIQAHQLYGDQKSIELSSNAVHTLTDLFIWAHFIAEKAIDYIKDVESITTIIDKISIYVKQHIEDNLTREDLANHVFLNPDYLSRIVKKETGLPLSEYIQVERISLAKELLSKTNMLVSEIAMKVGYDHFSQFSKIFKKHTNMTPMEYRHLTRYDETKKYKSDLC